MQMAGQVISDITGAVVGIVDNNAVLDPVTGRKVYHLDGVFDGGTVNSRLDELETAASEIAPAVRSLIDDQSAEIGFDNSPVLKEEEDEQGNPETVRPFRSVVIGDNNSYGDACFIRGDYNTNALGWVTVIGSRNKTYQFQTIFGDLNEFESAVNVTVIGQANKGGDKARSAFVVGNLNVVNGESSFTIGNRIANSAKHSLVFGRNLIVSDDVENEGGFFLGTGELTGSTVSDGAASFIHRVYKAVDNPLYTQGGTEPQYIHKRAPSTWYRGRFRPVEQQIAVQGIMTVTLDHDQYSRWHLVGGGTCTVSLENWENGDVGELVVDTYDQDLIIPEVMVIPEGAD